MKRQGRCMVSITQAPVWRNTIMYRLCPVILAVYAAAPESAWGMLAALHLEIAE